MVVRFITHQHSLTSVSLSTPVLSGWTYMLSVDGPAYGAALLAGVSAALFCFSPHFARIGDAKWAATASAPTKIKVSSD